MKIQILFVFLGFVIVSSSTNAEITGKVWTLIKDKNGIKIYASEYKNSKIKIFKGEAIVDAGVEVFNVMLREPSIYKDFLFRCKESAMIKKFAEDDILALNITSMPWPVMDREVLVRGTVEKKFSKGIFTVLLEGIPLDQYNSYIPISKNRKRMTKVWSIFILQVLSREQTRIVYHLYADPGGIPAGLVNLFMSDAPYETLLGMQRIVKAPKYAEIFRKAPTIPELEEYYKGTLNSKK